MMRLARSSLVFKLNFHILRSMRKTYCSTIENRRVQNYEAKRVNDDREIG